MPINRGKDNEGPYYKYGKHGKHYHYKPNNETSRKLAKKKANKQGIAINIRKKFIDN